MSSVLSAELRRGVRDSVPILYGYAPACVTFGAVGIGLGVPPLAVFLLSALLYAGASQFVMAKMLATGATAAVALLTVAVINVRYAVLSGALARRLTAPPAPRAATAALLTEEVYGVVQYGGRYGQRGPVPWRYLLGVELPPYLTTLVCTALGMALGGAVPQDMLPALNASLYALLIALVLPQMRRSRRVLVMCVLAAAVSTAVGALTSPEVGVLAALLAGAAFLRLTSAAGPRRLREAVSVPTGRQEGRADA